MDLTITISREQAVTLAHAIRPQIRAYVNTHRAAFERFLQAEQERDAKQEDGKRRGA